MVLFLSNVDFIQTTKQRPQPCDGNDVDQLIDKYLQNSNVERPLPPLPGSDGSLDRLDESPDESDDDLDNEDSDISVESSDDENNDQLTTEPSTRCLNGTSSNGNNECDNSFDPDATLPPSPSKTSNASLAELISPNSSHDVPSSPENDRFITQELLFDHFKKLFKPILN